jgi:hypothetical protein
MEETEYLEAIRLLELAMADRPGLAEHIARFLSLIWEGPKLPEGDRRGNLLADLAWDLEFFEPDPAFRKEGGFFGEMRAIQEIDSTLTALRGVALGHVQVEDEAGSR